MTKFNSAFIAAWLGRARAWLASRGTSNLNQRVLSALILAPVVLGCVWLGGAAFKLLVWAAWSIGMVEWLRLTVKTPTREIDGVALGGLSASLIVGGLMRPLWGIEIALIATLALFYFAQEAEKKAADWFSRSLWIAAGLPYLAWSGLGLFYARDLSHIGGYAILFLLFTVWGTDIGAYFAGRAIGGPKIAPQISPSKTWAGLFGGMALAALLAYLAALGFEDTRAWAAPVVAAVLAVIAQGGDFFESYVKRRAGAKDSGSLIPGHGGILDRVDGLLFAAMVWSVFLYLGERTVGR